MKITDENYDEVKAGMKLFLLNRIEKYYKDAGGKHKLSVALGYTYTHVEMVTKRKAFSALERLYKTCREKIDGVKNNEKELTD